MKASRRGTGTGPQRLAAASAASVEEDVSASTEAAEVTFLERAELTAHGSHIRRAKTPRRDPSERRKVHALPQAPKWSRTAIAWRVALATAVLGGFIALLATDALALVSATTTPPLVSFVLTGFGLAASTYFLLTLYHALRYRPVTLLAGTKLPRVTVIVPAYNEGAHVRVALESALASDYPEDRLEIIAIDDGSKDDTWEHILAVAGQHPTRIVPIQQPRNMGKREALKVGFEEATGELVVTVDSDSKLDPMAVRNIIAPMVADSEVAAVAGRVLVLNRTESIWTRLLSARFYLTFDLARAAQSRFGAVLCTPGALSAYRKSAVDGVLAQWSEQTFMGQPCTIAEDRALTTWLLRTGHRSVYQRTAVVETIVPENIRKMFRMLVRWERGNIREDLVMLPLLATKWRPRDQWWPTMEIVLELTQYPVAWLGLGMVFVRLMQHPESILTVGACVVFGAVVQCLYCLRSDRTSDFFFGVGYALFAFVGLQWVFPYSLVTVRDGRWLTR